MTPTTLPIHYQTKDEAINLYCEDCKPKGTSHKGTLVIGGYDNYCPGCGGDFKDIAEDTLTPEEVAHLEAVMQEPDIHMTMAELEALLLG
jgi:hypothetical protein